MHKFTIYQLMSRNCMKILGIRLDKHTVQVLSATSWPKKIHPPMIQGSKWLAILVAPPLLMAR